MNDKSERLIGDPELQRILGGVSAMTLHRWRARNILPPAIKIGTRNFTHQSVVDDLVRSGAPKKPLAEVTR